MDRADGKRNADGARAEALAARHLEKHGLAIVARNVRSRFGEIDLVARDGATLVFVEVRLRRSTSRGGAAESITAAKRARLVKAAQGYLATLAREPACRFDAVLLDGLDEARCEWVKDVVSA
ncbi:MAG: YraN family protein [Betaproteobacteria bacterium]|jgi:putative endonuclease|nr:YraN family protein [Betaproteobacteria bacterium]